MARRIPRYLRESNLDADAPLPRQIQADISQQAPYSGFSGVRLYYEDKEFTCDDCGEVVVWTAEDQKWWFETAKGHVFSSAKRCLRCRQLLRANHGGTPRKSHRDRRTENDAD
jgi:hypothetical protein